ncbi:MAG TPA: hypothetical protein DCK95_05805 [Anaerolineaceae bacterium]|uniref:Diguanylate cyclase n=1 Tax=Anaerolinea thermophila TaxID=167964 RepID=A0A101FZ08_9CHLR|nr:MAG: Diguanylate cyclase [Anaerolinea thermophila]HAF61822.1 hypothetical protein [Anaerolineaceae bacterium]
MKRNGNKIFNFKNVLKPFTILFAILFVISFLILFVVDNQLESTKIDEIERFENGLLDYQSSLLISDLNKRVNELHFIADAYYLKLASGVASQDIAEEWKIYADYKGIYDQLRFIDANGDEKIRIDYSENGAFIIDQSALQNKKDRYYFLDTANLNQGQILISRIDLNIENETIEMPIKPMIRFSTPVFNEDNEFIGIIILNYLADNYLNEFQTIANYSDGLIYLLNSEGYWISSDKPEQNWAFMYDEKKDVSFSQTFPLEWEEMQGQDHSFITENGFFTYKTIDLKSSLEDKQFINVNNIVFDKGTFKIVSFISNQSPMGEYFKINLFDKIKRTFQSNLPFFGLILIISVLGGFLLSLIRQAYTQTKFFSEYDAFTGTLNRRAGLALLNKLVPQDNRRKSKISLCFLDINGLKEVNDTLGHDAGDELILTIVNVIKQVIRETDFIIRIGGDEFIIVFVNISLQEAESVWDRILVQFDQINQTKNKPFIVSASHGIIEYDTIDESGIEGLIKRADEKMYAEKRDLKKNTIVIRSDQ